MSYASACEGTGRVVRPVCSVTRHARARKVEQSHIDVTLLVTRHARAREVTP